MRAVIVAGGLLMLGACGGGGTTGTNYSDAPPVAEIVATPSARPSETPTPEAAPVETEASAPSIDDTVNAAAVATAD